MMTYLNVYGSMPPGLVEGLAAIDITWVADPGFCLDLKFDKGRTGSSISLKASPKPLNRFFPVNIGQN